MLNTKSHTKALHLLSITVFSDLSMSYSLSSMACKPFSDTRLFSISRNQQPGVQFRSLVTRCETGEQSSASKIAGQSIPKLSIGSPIIITEAPKMIKTAASVPCLRVNSGLINPGDVGRIVSRKPMKVWAVRLSIGTYLVDEKYFKPLELEE